MERAARGEGERGRHDVELAHLHQDHDAGDDGGDELEGAGGEVEGPGDQGCDEGYVPDGCAEEHEVFD